MSTNPLALVDDPTFDALVNDEVRGVGDATVAAQLRLPENAERWYNSLNHMKKSVEAQLSADRAERSLRQVECLVNGDKIAWLTYRGERDKWRAGSIRFKNGVEHRLAEAKVTLRNQRSDLRVDLLRAERNLLLAAIKQHKATVASPSDADLELWKVIDG
jgi:hypothetical protein